MTKIQKASTCLLMLLNLLLIIIPIYLILNWILMDVPKEAIPSVLAFMKNLNESVQTLEGSVYFNTIQWTSLSQLLGFSADILGALPFLGSLLILRAIFKNYQKREIFTVANARNYKRLGIVLLLDALLINPISHMLLILAVTLTQSSGHRYLEVSLGNPNIEGVFAGVVVILISWVMLEASKLHEDQKFTI